MGVDVMIVGPVEDIARPGSVAIIEWLHKRWQEFKIPYGWVELNEADIAELELRFSDDPVGQMLLKKIARSGSLNPDEPIELMISY